VRQVISGFFGYLTMEILDKIKDGAGLNYAVKEKRFI
jgi:hypothetical protein